MKIQENVILAPYTTFKIGGPAKYFCLAENKDDLIKAVEFAQDKDLPYFILGGGSNLLVSDKGFNGLVIKIKSSEIKIEDCKIIAGAGVILRDLVLASIKNNLTGLEWAIGIPGTLGGAVKVNASCFGGEMKKLVKKIEKIKHTIISVELELKKGDSEKSKALIKEISLKRKQKQPLKYPSAGCIFKNPENQFAGQLIEQAGLKGKRIRQAMVSDKHANFIINLGKAQAKDVMELIDLIKKRVKDKFDLDLEEEIEYLGF